MIKRIQARPRWQRIIIFVLMVVAVIAPLLAVTLAIVTYSYNDTPRNTATAMQDYITVREFVQLPDENAYPAALALADDGTLYTGSYVNGAIWQISPDGAVQEVANTRAEIGAITGLALATDGTLIILDRRKPLETTGAIIWQLTPDGKLQPITQVAAATLRLPYDVAVDAAGLIYVSDAHPQSRLIWRYDPSTQNGDIWWQLPDNSLPTRLLFNPQDNNLLVADTSQDRLYAVAVTASNPNDAAQIRYEFTGSPVSQPGLDGIAIGDENTLFVSALGLNRVGELNLTTGNLDYLAGAFRGSSDIAYDAFRRRLYVTNWEQRALLPEPFLVFQIDILPKLPFALDVIEWE